jgi:lysophospholipase L1-like esterase
VDKKSQLTVRRKVLFRGGSIAAGCGVKTNYLDVLRDRYLHRNVEIINRSRKGETSFDGVDSFYADIDPCRPDILMLHFGIDDAYAAVYRSEFKENLVRIIRLAGERFSPVVFLLTSHPFDDPHEMEAVHIYYRTIREVAVDLRCRMIPVHTHWAGYLEESGVKHADLVQADVRLPNEQGHRLLADIVAANLDGIMGKPGFSQPSVIPSSPWQ